jgi:hypothetical protein
LKGWQKGVAALVSTHAIPVLAVSTALAGPLLALAGHEGGGINFFGASSRGKTTVAQAAASVWGRGSSPGFVRAWRATANGLEGVAASATDTVLILDELGVVEARDAASAIYGLANGTGKARAARDGSLRDPKTWRTLILSTGELPIEGKLAEDKGRRAKAGQLVRMLDIPADRGFGFGIFDHGGQDGDASRIADAIKRAAVTDYGIAGPEFVRGLLSKDPERAVRDLRMYIDDFVSSRVPSGADGQVIRAAQRLGLIGAAGELARGRMRLSKEQRRAEMGGRAARAAEARKQCRCRADVKLLPVGTQNQLLRNFLLGELDEARAHSGRPAVRRSSI